MSETVNQHFSKHSCTIIHFSSGYLYAQYVTNSHIKNVVLTQSRVSLPGSYSKREDAIVFSADSLFLSVTELKSVFPSSPSFILCVSLKTL